MYTTQGGTADTKQFMQHHLWWYQRKVVQFVGFNGASTADGRIAPNTSLKEANDD